MHRIGVPPLALLIIFICGCGSGGLVPVKGKVLVGKKPLTTGSVTFHPDKKKGNDSTAEPRGTIGSDGTYTMMTRDGKGVAPGWYKVTVLAQKEADQTKAGAMPVYLVADQYLDVLLTPLSVEVKSDAPEGHYDLKLFPRR